MLQTTAASGLAKLPAASPFTTAATLPVLQAHDVDACAVDPVEPLGRRLKYDITIDSGAGSSAIDPDDVPEYKLEPSDGQAKGQQFIGAGGEKMPNLG